MTSRLTDLLGLRAREHVAFVGAGGKSTLLLGVGHEIAGSEAPVVMATTTRMSADQAPAWAELCTNLSQVERALASATPAFLIEGIEGSKAMGISPLLADEIYQSTAATVLVEADGAQGRPFKAPAAEEPVIPSTTTLVVVVAGMDGLGGIIADVCHRPERVAALTGRRRGDLLRAEDMAKVLGHEDGGRKGVPPGARLVFVLAKVEARHQSAVEEITSRLPERVLTIPRSDWPPRLGTEHASEEVLGHPG